ncbi:MAG: WXG100 family type VII secretion target [Lachnospiraceae bacterium]|nr:WXG100 family type VII secretion target [Lachnospiraceae bacterium]
MSEIQVTSSTLRNRADDLAQLNEQFKSAVNSLTEEEGALRAQFEGEASDAFHSAFSKDTIQMGNFYNAVADYVTKLIQIADAYEKAEQTNVSTASARNY